MIDTDKYEGHTPAPWVVIDGELYHRDNNEDFHLTLHDKAVAQLIADAPLLLEEVKRLRSLGMGTGTDGTEATGWVKKINSLNAEVKRLRDHIRRMRHWAEPKMQEVHHDAWRKLHEEIYEGDD